MDEDRIWDDLVADPWIRLADVVDGQSRPFGDAAADALEPLAGASVLDVGCGTGQTTWRLGARVGASGSVTGVDLSGPFIEAARRGGDAANVTFRHDDATTVALPPVDAVFSRNGVMFFPDPVAAFAHLRALGRPGARLGFTCWQDVSANQWMMVPVMASVPVLGPPQVPPPGAPGPFSLADPDTIRSVLHDAGWAGLEVDGLALEHPFPAGDARACAEVMVLLLPPLAAGVEAAPEKRAALVEAVAEALREYEHDGQVVFPAASWIVTARRDG
jgi:SAM-dependent methyltransferase